MVWLLDTHALLSALYDPAKLGRKTRAIPGDPMNEVLLSPVSYWAISLKYGLGKLELPDTDPSEIPAAAAQLGLVGIAIEAEVLATFHRLLYAPDHRDPFDRLLIWLAISRNDIFLTKDRSAPFFKAHGLRTDW